MAQANPFDQFDEPAAAPQSSVTVNRGRSPADARAARADARAQTEFEERNKPTLPTGFQWIDPNDPSKGAQPIPGTKDKKEAELSDEQKAMIDGIGVDNLVAAVRKAREAIGTGRATGVTGAVARIIPGTKANDLDAALDTLKGNVMLDKLTELKQASPTGASGLGALSEIEVRMLASVIASLSNRQSDEALLDSLNRIEGHALSLKAIRSGRDPKDPAVQKEFGITVAADNRDALAGANGGGQGGSGGRPPAPSGPSPNGGDRLGFAQGEYRDEQDPARVGVNARVRAMLGAYKSPAEIVQYLNSVSPGLGDQQAGAIAAAAQFRQRNPTVPIEDYPVSLEMRRVPMSATEQTINNVAQSPLGAGVIGAADQFTFGTLDNMTGNPALTRAAMSGVQKMNPGSYLAGQVGGQALLGLGVEGGLGRLGANRITTMLAGDSLPGMAYGAGTADDGNRGTGALTGGLAGVIGGVSGRVTGRAISGVQDANVGYLAQSGVRMTPGQVAGGMAKRLEDAWMSVPGIGDLIRNQRRNSLEDFNRATFRETLAPIGATAGDQIGEAGVQNAQDAVSQAYRDALGGVRIDLNDPQFVTDATQAVAQGRAIPNLGPSFDAMAQSRFGNLVDPSGTVAGETVQDVLQGLRQGRTAPNVLNDPLGPEFGNATRDLEGALIGAVERQAPEVMPRFNAANEAYGNLATVENAVLAAKNNNGMFMPSQLGTASVNGTKSYFGRAAAARGDRPFFELQRAGQEVLPSQVPDSGTPLRMLAAGGGLAGLLGGGAGYATGDEKSRMGDAASGAGTGLAAVLGTAGLLSLPYLGRGAIQNFLTRARPEGLRRAGDFVANSRLPGSLAVPLLVTEQ